MQTRTFDQLLDESVGNKGLALEVKKAEMVSNDLINLVRVSDLKSRDQVVERLNKYMREALVHVVATLDVDLEELRTRVSHARCRSGKIPIDVHIRSIKAGVESKTERRAGPG